MHRYLPRMTLAIRRLGRDAQGSTAIFTAVAGVALIGFTGLGIDVGYWELSARKIQSAADAAALAAVVAQSNGETTTEIASAAQAVTASYGFVNGQNGTTITVNEGYGASGNEVQVKISQSQTRYFSQIFLASAPTVTASAAAKPSSNTSGTMCLMTFDQNASDTSTISLGGGVNLCLGGNYDPSSGTCQSPTCDVYNNSPNASSTTFSGNATLDAHQIFLSGGYTLGNNAAISPNPPATYVAPTPDPYGQLSISTSGGVITVSDPYQSISKTYSSCGNNKIDVNAGAQQTIDPGVYCEIDVEAGGQLTLNPGTYVIDRGNLKVKSGNGNYGSLSASSTGGATIILTSSKCTSTAEFGCSDIGQVTLGSQVTVSLTAPNANATRGIPAIAIWVDKRAAQANNSLNGGTNQNINGVIYMPSQNANYAGGSDTLANGLPASACTQLLAYNITVNGNTFLTHSDCSALNFPVRDPSLAPLLAE